MYFTDDVFIALFAILLIASYLLRRFPAFREWLIIAFSAMVIASWGLFSLVLFFSVLAINFVATRAIAHSTLPVSRFIVVIMIVFDVALLAIFKYSAFVNQMFLHIFSTNVFPQFTLGIPLAISFYTFHLISYIVDVHKGRVKIAGLRQYVFYLSFFPHVIAGPIVRAWQLMPQVGKTRSLTSDLPMGFHFLVVGAFFKSVVSDNIADVIDPIWANNSDFLLSAADRWVTAFLYYCQIYADFGGYSLMALGMARMLGYRLPANFRSPMRAASLQEFWRRWHITLSHWLRDYLYIPLGGSRVAAPRWAANVLTTMLLGGLWHGAGWNFVIWGAMHGTGIVAERMLGQHRTRALTGTWIGWWIITQVWVTMTWVFFRSNNLSNAFLYLEKMFNFMESNAFILHGPLRVALVFCLPVLLHHAYPLVLWRLRGLRLAGTLGALTGAMLVLTVVIYSPPKVFIYFKF